MGMHAKHFIIDDRAYYIGSQNLYACDFAEWGILIDDPAQTKKCMTEYWNPLWKASFTGQDCNDDNVMDGLDVDRTDNNPDAVATKKQIEAAKRRQYNVDPDSEHHHSSD